MKLHLFSAPNEEYVDHITRCLERFKIIYPLYAETCKRILDVKEEGDIEDALEKMIMYHDLGKLTKRWQEAIQRGEKRPPHAGIGAGFLWKHLPKGLREPLSFAVAIHHSNSGLLGDEIERPDTQAILAGIVDLGGRIVWSSEVNGLNDPYFPEEAKDLTIYDLREMSRELRIWARGEGLLEQHRRRLQVALVHHILKLCDISSASERSEFSEENKREFYGGYQMVREVVGYVKSKESKELILFNLED